ncbi:hypothetical protein CTN07_22305 [Photobacterium damselae]|nr:hypothetical protein CTN07_22305 [Photobacterium damselae]
MNASYLEKSGKLDEAREVYVLLNKYFKRIRTLHTGDIVRLSQPTVATQAQDNGQFVTIFEHDNFQGRAKKIIGDIVDLGDFNNQMSSYKIPKGWQVRFYEGANFQGGFYTRSSDGWDSTFTAGFNDKIKSIKIIKKEGSVAKLGNQ